VTLPNLALLGKAGAGKDKAAALLRQLYPGENGGPIYQRVAFADALKNVAVLIWGESARTNREYLQQLGVAVREIDADAWVNAAINSIRPPTVVTDVRFPNEVQALVALGFVTVRIEADRGTRLNRLRDNGKLQDESQLDHISETALDTWATDYTVENTGGEYEFAHRLVQVVDTERRRRG
jgi:dephospho-CoA kinase